MEDRLEKIRSALLHLHKVLVDQERLLIERAEGAQKDAAFLERVVNDAALAWLRMLSAVIVRIDEWLEDDAHAANETAALIDAVRTLLTPDAAGNAFQRRYAEVMPSNPDAVLAHAAATRALKG